MDLFIIILQAAAGVVLATILGFVLSILFEMAISIGKLHAAAGGMLWMALTPVSFTVAVVVALIAIPIGVSGWSLVLAPIFGCLGLFTVIILLRLIGSVMAKIFGDHRA